MDDAAVDRRIRAMVVRRYPRSEIAEQLGLTLPELGQRIARIWTTHYHTQLKSAEAERQRLEREPDPTPEEIAERAAEIRAGWTEVEHRRRAGLPETSGWEAPQVSVRGSC